MSSIAIGVLETTAAAITTVAGLYAAIHDTKPKDGKITYAGRWAIAFILMGGFCSITIRGWSTWEKQVAIEQQRDREKMERDSLNRALAEEKDFKVRVEGNLLGALAEIRELAGTSSVTLDQVKSGLVLQTQLGERQKRLSLETERTQKGLFPMKVMVVYDIPLSEPIVARYMDDMTAVLDSVSEGSLIVDGSLTVLPSGFMVSSVQSRFFPQQTRLGQLRNDLLAPISVTVSSTDATPYPAYNKGVRMDLWGGVPTGPLEGQETEMVLYADKVQQVLRVFLVAKRPISPDLLGREAKSHVDLKGKYIVCASVAFEHKVQLRSVEFMTENGYGTKADFSKAERKAFRTGSQFYFVRRLDQHDVATWSNSTPGPTR